MSTRPWLSALTPESRDKILTMVENGHSLKVACNRERVPYATLSKAFQYAEAALAHPDFDPVDFTPDENEIIAFYQSILAAQARCQDRLLTKIRDADDWKAALRLLQKVNAEDYAEPTKATKTSQAQGSASASSVGTDNPLLSPRINLKLLTFEELQQLEALIRKATPTDDPPDKIVVPHRPAPATQRNKNL